MPGREMIHAMYDSRCMIRAGLSDDSRRMIREKNGDNSRTDGDDSRKRNFFGNVFIEVFFIYTIMLSYCLYFFLILFALDALA